MKATKLNYISVLGFLLFLIACSTKKDNFANRNFQALNTKYNVLFNGQVALDKGIEDLKKQYVDNYWDILPVERQEPEKPIPVDGKPKNADFDRAETKATKAIQKRSMNIDGTERNYQIDEAYLMLGKARYYDKRYVPSIDAFNYILYKYPTCNKIYEAKIWREKANIRLDNDEIAIKNLTLLLKEIKEKNQIYADANAILAQAFIKINQKEDAIAKLKIATIYTKQNEEKARYHYILAQLYEQLGYKDSAFASYQKVIDMKRKAPRVYIIHAEARQAQQFDFTKGDTILFLKKFNDLLKDRENRPFLDVLNHQLALFYNQQKNDPQAKKYYNKSIVKRTADQYLLASNYRNLADIYFYSAQYETAGKYYDSTLTKLNERTKEYRLIKKKRENLEDVIKYEAIASKNDSILKILAMSNTEKNLFFQKYIDKLKKQDLANKALEEKRKLEDSNIKDPLSKDDPPGTPGVAASKNPSLMPPIPSSPMFTDSQSSFYFYNANTVAFGKVEFRKNWGDRELKENWRYSAIASKNATDSNDSLTENDDISSKEALEQEPKYTVGFYKDLLPTTQSEIDLLIKDRNFAYYQLGGIYKEKFKEYLLAKNKLETLLSENPEERLILPSMYNLFKVYEILGLLDKAQSMKEKILSKYPDSRYAQILDQTGSKESANETPESVYKKWYNIYESRDYRLVYNEIDALIDQYTGEEIIPKLELLKANVIGKIKGVAEFKKALNFVALNYPNSFEGKSAEGYLSKNIPLLEALQFNSIPPKSWKIIYEINDITNKNVKVIQDKIAKFLEGRESMSTSFDLYTLSQNFIVIHGIKNEEVANGIVEILKEFKDYKIQEKAIVISNENYKVVQIKKNLDEYLKDPKKTAVISQNREVVPSQNQNVKGVNDTKNQVITPQERIFSTDNDPSTATPPGKKPEKNPVDDLGSDDPLPNAPKKP